MNREDIERMAREADDFADSYTPQYVTLPNEWSVIRDERFFLAAYAAGAAAERDKYEAKFKQLEAIMQVREQQPNKPCCLAEREACAKVCASLDETDMRSRYDYRRGVLDCVDAIRARGKQNDL